MIGQSEPHPSVRVREVAVEPQARRFNCSATQNDCACFLTEGLPRCADPPRHAAGYRLLIRSDTGGEGIRYQCDRSPRPRPQICCQRHWNVADRCGALSLQVNWCTQRLEAALRTVATERAPLSTRKHE